MAYDNARWDTELVGTNGGPQLCRPPQGTETPESNVNVTVSLWHTLVSGSHALNPRVSRLLVAHRSYVFALMSSSVNSIADKSSVSYHLNRFTVNIAFISMSFSVCLLSLSSPNSDASDF